MKTITQMLVTGGLTVTLGLSFGAAISAEEIKVGGGSAPMENIFKKVEEPFEKATGVQLILTSEGPDQAFINVEKGAIDVAAAGLSFES